MCRREWTFQTSPAAAGMSEGVVKMSTADLRLGIIGLDTSHVTAFTELLHNEDHEYHVPGAKIVVAYPGGSPDFPRSYDRVGRFTTELRGIYGVQIVDELSDIPPLCDGILLESVDGRVHYDQFKKIVQHGKPVFIDKPFSLRSDEAAKMVQLADTHHTPLMSCSALRYSEAITPALSRDDGGDVIGCDTFGPMAIEPTQPGLFWYGIHCVEMLFAVLGRGCVNVTAIANKDHDEIVGVWSDGRMGTIRGNRKGNNQFAAVIHREREIQFVDVSAYAKPFYASLLERIVLFFRTGTPSCEMGETQQIVRFIECANESRSTGTTVHLH